MTRNGLVAAGVLLAGGVVVWFLVGRREQVPAGPGGGGAMAAPARALARAAPTPAKATAPVPAVRTGRICGLVVDAAGRRPVAGAMVALRGPGGSATQESGAAGRFCFPGLPAGTYCLMARLGHRASDTVDDLPLGPGEQVRDVALTLRLGVLVSGRVRDRTTGAGVAGAAVSARIDGLGVAAARTDGDGDFRLGGLGSGLHVLEVSAAGYATGSVELSVTGRRAVTGVDLWIDRAAALGGTVVDAAGKPVVGAVVDASPYHLTASPAPVVASARQGTVTDAAGRFHLTTAPGLVTLFATADGHGPGRLEGVQATLGAPVTGLVIHMTRPAGLVLDVLAPGGGPAAGARVRVLCEGNLLCAYGAADAAGHLRFDHLAPGHARVRADGAGLGEAQADVALDAGLERRLTLALGGTGTIAGRVADARGGPVPGAAVSLVSELGPGDVHGTETQDDGTFLAQVPVQVPFTVAVAIKGTTVAEKRGVLAGDQIHLVARTPGRITGIVVGPDGQPVTDFTVVAVPAPGGADGGRAGYTRRRFASETGDFVLPGLPPGAYRVRASAPDAAASAQVDTVVDPGGEAGPLRLVLGAAGRIRGRVIDEKGGPVAGARVAVDFGRVYGIARFSGEAGPTAESGIDGSFLLADVPAGRSYRVFAYKPETLAGSGGPVRVVADADAGPVTIRVRRPPHSRPDDADAFGGVGMTVGSPGAGLVVVEHVYEGGPAFFAGLRHGDVLVSVDGRPVEGLGLHGTLDAIRGPVGTVVTLELRRPSTGDHFVARVVRVLLRL